MSLFPTDRRPSHLVQFNAGKCIREGNMLKPDLRKGLVYMDQSNDQLMHFYWKERKASQPEEDLIIFPDEAELVRVPECTTGRVYLLKFKSSSQRMFFWMQNANTDKDDQLVERVNKLINNPQAAIEESSRNRGSNLVFDGDAASSDLMQILGDSDEITQENLLQFLQSAGELSGPIGSLDDLERQQPMMTSDQLNQLKDSLQSVTVSPDASFEALEDLEDVLAPESIGPLLNNGDILQALFPFVEPAERSQEEIHELTRSSEFKNALQRLHTAISEGKLSSLLDDLDWVSIHDVYSFLTMMEDEANRRQHQQEGEAMEED
ncbi:proteasome complex subunit Rpn13 ubiquitin receptor-domain-containing protein [Radiomyces spectabilis]|uniref:proteasome complex subunit Rpn13 ubiquitin receptor-domain-containing protein n=1 Tax=Radiomyces spectabilis TaxID=64574 RepID=UPI002220C45E|nr:proteasome complex subunit Rpn13 ubiquitin receptor-domain-containing protein [Radiomyces spectabilis]KAI8368302.1 proteasome complex subunit Rpn13 ubiquitin receptor-domain-containing protein [Radiomyces spectabilis]